MIAHLNSMKLQVKSCTPKIITIHDLWRKKDSHSQEKVKETASSLLMGISESLILAALYYL